MVLIYVFGKSSKTIFSMVCQLLTLKLKILSHFISFLPRFGVLKCN